MKFLILLLLLNITILGGGNPKTNNPLGYVHTIQQDRIKTMEVYVENTNESSEEIVTLKEDKSVAEVELSNTDNQSINKLIAKRILDFEGEDIVNTSEEYSKYGITKETLDNYNKVKGTDYTIESLKQNEAIEIILYLMEVFRVTEIRDPRIRIVVFDTIYNTGSRRAVYITQNTFNFYNDLYGDGKRINVDRILGNDTINKLNQIENVDIYVQLFIYERLNTYKKFKTWSKYGNGWTKRILTVSNIKI